MAASSWPSTPARRVGASGGMRPSSSLVRGSRLVAPRSERVHQLCDDGVPRRQVLEHEAGVNEIELTARERLCRHVVFHHGGRSVEALPEPEQVLAADVGGRDAVRPSATGEPRRDGAISRSDLQAPPAFGDPDPVKPVDGAGVKQGVSLAPPPFDVP